MISGNQLLRIGLGAVFFYFSVMQIIDPEPFTSYLPQFLQGSYSVALVYMNAVLDFVLSLTLVLGVLPRIVPVIAAAHLIGIAITMGLDDVAVRDIGLGIACLSLAFMPVEQPLWKRFTR